MKTLTYTEKIMLASGLIKIGDGQYVKPDDTRVQDAVAAFTQARPRFKPCAANRNAMMEKLAEAGWTLTAQSLCNAYDALVAKNALELQDEVYAVRIISLADAPQAHVERFNPETGETVPVPKANGYFAATSRHSRNRAQFHAAVESEVAAKIKRESGR